VVAGAVTDDNQWSVASGGDGTATADGCVRGSVSRYGWISACRCRRRPSRISVWNHKYHYRDATQHYGPTICCRRRDAGQLRSDPAAPRTLAPRASGRADASGHSV